MSRDRPPLPGTPALLLVVTGGTLAGVGAGMLISAAVAALGDGRSVAALAIPGVVSALIGLGLLAPTTQRRRGVFANRPTVGFLAVALAWITAAIAGAVPLIAAGSLSSPIDAVFESMSGFTTTGATLIEKLEAEPQGILMWRSLMQWLGGVGIIVLVVSIAPSAGAALQRIFYAEVSGITAERLTPRIVDTAKIIVGVYLVLTASVGIAYAIAGMGIFDAANHMLTTPATGGFSTRTASIGAFDSIAIEIIAIAGMILAGVNFAFYWRAIKGARLMPQLAEVRAYLALLVVVTIVLTTSLLIAGDFDGFGDALRAGSFATTTIMTGTGYVTSDFDAFNDFARTGLLILMSVGACAGSTAGGIKVVRFILLWKAARQELDRQVQPRAVHVLRLGGLSLSEDIRRAVLGFFAVYVTVYIAGALAFSAAGLEPLSAISGSAATLNIVGPALGEIGGTETYGALAPGGRIVAVLLMLTGRLEIFTIVALLAAVVGYFRRGGPRPAGLPRL